jgi:hypothetical protein
MENLRAHTHRDLNFKNTGKDKDKFDYRASYFRPPPNTKISSVLAYAQDRSNRMRTEFGQTEGFFQISLQFDNNKWMTTRSTQPGEPIKGLAAYDNDEFGDNVTNFVITYSHMK